MKSSFVADCQLPDSCLPCLQELGKVSGLDHSTSQTNSSTYVLLAPWRCNQTVQVSRTVPATDLPARSDVFIQSA